MPESKLKPEYESRFKPKYEERLDTIEEYLELIAELLDNIIRQLQPGVRIFSFNYYKNNREEIKRDIAEIEKNQQSKIIKM